MSGRRRSSPRRGGASPGVSPAPTTPGRSSSPPPFESSPGDGRDADDAVDDDDREEVDRILNPDPVDVEEDDEGEELIGDQMDEDYRAIPELDVYDPAMLADENEEVEELDAAARARIEREMRKRDRAEARGRTQGRGRDVLDRFAEDDDGDDDELGDGQDPLTRRRMRRRAEMAAGVGDGQAEALGFEDLDDNVPVIENLDERKGNTLREWVLSEPVDREIFRRFRNFLATHTDEQGNNVHFERIKTMCQTNGESLVVSYTDLCVVQPVLAIYVADAPTEMLAIFDRAAKEVVLEHFPEYEQIRPEIHVRINDLPVMDSIRELRQSHLNSLIKVSGVVTRRTGIFPQLKLAKYACAKCAAVMGPFVQDGVKETPPITQCPECQSKGPFTLNAEETVYRNYQKITVQESPGTVDAGRLPRQKDVVMLWDLVDQVKPGDEIEVTGIYRNQFDSTLNSKHGFPIFATVIECNYVQKLSDKFANVGLTDEDVATIRKLSKQDGIATRIFKSIAPSIHGHEDIKVALALALFGGEAKEQAASKMRTRGDINVLMVGDPGTAKSQFLKWTERVCPRAVFTTGQGASAVGLTAAVSRDPLTREWTLQGGALVLADQGVCLIDEFDKMNDQDRTSIHEAMEQQTISISKAGIVTSLQARCAVIAAANPLKGKYQPSLTFAQNVDLTEPIISRFDILCVVKDVVDPVKDELLAKFVVGNHRRSHPDEADADKIEAMQEVDADIIPQELLKKYILFAKQNVRPKLHNMDQDKITDLYTALRRESQATGSIPITARMVDAIIRLSEAHARLHLRDYVRDDDVSMAIRVVVTSFVETQKFSISKQMQRSFSKYMTFRKDEGELLSFILNQMYQDELRYKDAQQVHDDSDPSAAPAPLSAVEIDLDSFTEKAKTVGVHDLSKFFSSETFHSAGYEYDGVGKVIVRQI